MVAIKPNLWLMDVPTALLLHILERQSILYLRWVATRDPDHPVTHITRPMLATWAGFRLQSSNGR